MDRAGALKRIESYRILGPNWDSYGAEEFDRDFLDAVRDCIAALPDSAFPLTHICPYSGGVQLDWDAGLCFLEVTLHRDGALTWLSGVNDDESTWQDGEAEAAAVQLHRILSHDQPRAE